MSKPAIVAAGAASVVALGVVLGVLALRNERPPAAPAEVPPEPRPAEPRAARGELVPVAEPSAGVPGEPDAGELVDEASLLAKLHELGASDPPQSLQLAKEAVARFPDSPNAPEFHWNVVKALFNLRQLDEAKDEARIMLWKYPDNYYTGDVVRHLLNPPPNPSDLPGRPASASGD
jgi:hypothetical protein